MTDRAAKTDKTAILRPKEPAPPWPCRLRSNRLPQAMLNTGGHRSMQCVVPQHFFNGREFVGRLLLSLLMGKLLFLLGLMRGKF